MLNTYLFLGLCLSIFFYTKGVYGEIETNRDKAFLATAVIATIFGWAPLFVVAYCRKVNIGFQALTQMIAERLGV